MKNHTIPPDALTELLSDCCTDRIIAIDNQWRIIAWNTASENFTGLKKEALLNKRLQDVFPEIMLDAELTGAIRAAMQGCTSMVEAREGAFNRHYYENNFIPLKDKDGHIQGVMNIMHNVEHRIKAEQQLQQLNTRLTHQYRQLEKANNELATFAGITGAELKEPIRKIYTSLETIMRTDGPLLSDASKAALRRMQSSISGINFLLDDIIALAKASRLSFEFTRVNLNQVLENALAQLQDKIQQKHARIKADTLPVITGNSIMLEYLFINLIDNALKFQPQNNIPEVNISAVQHEHFVHLHFQDNGIGFPESEADKAFVMFERLHGRRQYPGSGIGLTVSRKIAEAHGGYMEATSEPGKGATFTCCLAVQQHQVKDVAVQQQA